MKKLLNNDDKKNSKDIRIPELQINGVCKNVITCLGHVHHIYWLLITSVFLVLFVILMPHYKFKEFWAGIKAQGITVTLLLVFSFIAVSLLWSAGQKIDVWAFMLLNTHGQRAPWLDWFMLWFTQLGSGVFSVIVAFVLYLTAKNLLAYELIFGTLTLWLVVELIKILIRRDRPFTKLKEIRVIGSHARGNSFPSGHTSQAFFTVTLLLHYFNVNVLVWIGLYIISFLVGITRIYVGMHYPRDVAGGAMLGTAWGFIGLSVNCYIFNIC